MSKEKDIIRVNIEVKRGLWKQLKIRAAMKELTLIEIVEDALKLYLSAKEKME